MNVEEYLRAQVPGYPFSTEVLTYAAYSPIFAEPTAMRGLNLTDDIRDIADDEEMKRSLKYATSTLYYAVSGVFAGGSKSEQVGDVKVSVSGFTITQSDRDHYREMADEIRAALGSDKKSDTASDSGMFDATPLRRRSNGIN